MADQISAETLDQLRAAARLPRKDVARGTGLSETHIREVLTGKKRASDRALRRVEHFIISDALARRDELTTTLKGLHRG